MLICKIEDCDRTVDSKGYCGRHYSKWRIYGNPLYIKDKLNDCYTKNCMNPRYALGYCESCSKNYYQIKDDVVIIKLTQNQATTIDIGDWELVKKYKWHAAHPSHYSNENAYQAKHTKPRNGEGKQSHIYMHNLIMDCRDKEVDHIDRNPLNNKRNNLRISSTAENCRNKLLQSNNKSGYKGVYKKGDRYRAMIRINRKLKHLGTFKNPEDAYLAYREVAVKYHGEFFNESYLTDEQKERLEILYD